MVKLATTRKARFKAALLLHGWTQEDWAKANGISRGYLNRVLNERMESKSLTAKIDAFIEDTESRRKVLVA